MKPIVSTCPSKVFLYENTHIFSNAKLIISDRGEGGRFILKKWSGAAQGLTVITGNHSVNPPINKFMMQDVLNNPGEVNKDVVVNEDVWIGANVTLCAGVHVGRGSIIGAGAVVRNDVPPYSIVAGNPAKVISFVFLPREIVKHEETLYNKDDRIPLEILEKNYKKYYAKRIRKISEFIE